MTTSTLESPEPDLWTLAAAREAAKAGMKTAAANNGDPYQAYARRFIIGYVRDNPTMHQDDLKHAGMVPPAKGSPTGVGNIIATLAREGWIKKIPDDRVPGAFLAKASIASNGAPKWIWQSCAPEWGGSPKTDA